MTLCVPQSHSVFGFWFPILEKESRPRGRSYSERVGVTNLSHEKNQHQGVGIR